MAWEGHPFFCVYDESAYSIGNILLHLIGALLSTFEIQSILQGSLCNGFQCFFCEKSRFFTCPIPVLHLRNPTFGDFPSPVYCFYRKVLFVKPGICFLNVSLFASTTFYLIPLPNRDYDCSIPGAVSVVVRLFELLFIQRIIFSLQCK